MNNVTPDTSGAYIQAPTPDDLVNLIYTLVTTGKPKGVELTHLNFTSNVLEAAWLMMKNVHNLIHHNDVSLAFLPWAHSYGQTCELWLAMAHRMAMGVSHGILSILEDLQLNKPIILFAVQTLYNRIYDGVNNFMENGTSISKEAHEIKP